MLFKAVLSATIAATSVLAAPLKARASDYFGPSDIWLYSVRDGAISATSHGEVYKNDGNQGKDITTLLTFTYPSASEGLQCQFEFYLDSTASVSGSKKLDLFTSNSPAPGPTSGWGPGNQRNIHLGRLSVEVDSYATWDATYSTYLTEKTPCKAPGTTEGFELVGVYDNDSITWNPDLAGLRIVYSS
jgi:hypothetical protein